MGREIAGLVDFKKAIAAIILLAALLSPALAHAECSKLVDKHLEYYAGLKTHLTNDPNFDPSIREIPYDVKIISDHSQQYSLYSANVSFFYPNGNTTPINLEFQDSYLQAICIIQTPDGLKWVVWRDDNKLYFYDENEQPH